MSTTPPLTLLRRASPLSQPNEQRRLLEAASEQPPFHEKLREHGLQELRADPIQVLQVNVGKLCNQTCHHCHVDAGPDRRESMSRETAQAVIDVLRGSAIPTLDITGGAPEMNPNFAWLVEQARGLGRRVIDRCNLTILLAPGFTHLPKFLAAHQVEVVASLPCYLEENCDRQRGDGVFNKSIEAIRLLNGLGYGLPDSGLPLTLVYNPTGLSLPPSQTRLEEDYRRELRTRYGLEFTRLLTITNMPISRFLEDLIDAGEFDNYLRLLVDSFNPHAVDGLMCRTTLSVDWEGRLYDCDFNQMLELPVHRSSPRTVFDLDLHALADRPIVCGRHCYGCTAGAGSGCNGEIAALAE